MQGIFERAQNNAKRPAARSFKIKPYFAVEMEEHEVKRVSCPACEDILFEPVMCDNIRCGGLCCRRCAMMWTENQAQCPYECGKKGVGFLFSPCEAPIIQLRCPYNGCILETAEQFMQHMDTCKFASQEVLEQRRLKRNNLCRNEHSLSIFISDEQNYETKCTLCKVRYRCRNYCSTCEQPYCISCRPLICSKSQPPVDQYYIRHISNLEIRESTCDICGLKPFFGNCSIRKDLTAEITICDYCYHFLPAQIPFTPPYSSYSECKDRHKLTNLGKIITKQCSTCSKVAHCKKQCFHCTDYYCLSCKKEQIVDEKCQIGHSFTVVIRQSGSDAVTCEHCTEPVRAGQGYAFDKDCKLSICRTCIIITKNRQLNRFAIKGMQQCRDNHKQFYLLPGAVKYIDDCSQCEKKLELKYACATCDVDGIKKYKRVTCLRCLDPKMNMKCPVGHPFWNIPNDLVKVCHKCTKTTFKGVYCKDCQLSLCQDCYQAGKR